MLFRRKPRAGGEFEEELEACREILFERHLAAGMPADEARRKVALEWGSSVTAIQAAEVREASMGVWAESLLYDFRHGFRVLWRDRAFSCLAILTAALGIGINAAVFSALHTVVLKSLPYERPEALTIIWSKFERMGAPRAPGAGPELAELQARNRLFQGIGGIWVGNSTIQGEPEPEQIKMASVTANFFDVLGARPQLGRTFTSDDPASGRPKGAVISDGLWRRRFGADPNIVGRPLRLRNNTVTIAGVMPPDFQLYFPADSNVPAQVPVFVPFESGLAQRPAGVYFLRFIGRMKTGVTLQQAQADLDSVARHLRASFTEYAQENLQLNASILQADTVRDLRPGLLALMAGAGFVLLIGCVNIANLLLVRGAVRRREIALRAAIGASRGRVIRQFVMESLALGVVSGAAGTVLGAFGIRIWNLLRPESLGRFGAIELSPQVLLFVLAISLGSALLFGVIPALHATRINLAEGSRDARGSSRSGMRNVLIVAEVTLGFVLITGAGLMLRTFERLQQESPGFEARGVLTFELQPRGSRRKPCSASFATASNRCDPFPACRKSARCRTFPWTTTRTGTAPIIRRV